MGNSVNKPWDELNALQTHSVGKLVKYNNEEFAYMNHVLVGGSDVIIFIMTIKIHLHFYNQYLRNVTYLERKENRK